MSETERQQEIDRLVRATYKRPKHWKNELTNQTRAVNSATENAATAYIPAPSREPEEPRS